MSVSCCQENITNSWLGFSIVSFEGINWSWLPLLLSHSSLVRFSIFTQPSCSLLSNRIYVSPFFLENSAMDLLKHALIEE
jgi:hypothetical protein